MITITINNKDYNVPENITVFQACRQLGIDIPSLCYDERLEPEGSCNLCVVEVEGHDELLTSCTLRATPNMKLYTHTERVIVARKAVLEKLLKNRPADKFPIDDSNPFYSIDPNKCIACNLCVRVCEELQGRGALELTKEGYVARKPVTPENNVECESCGNCLAVCPTGAIREKDNFNFEFAEMSDFATKNLKTTCSYCGVGCQMELVVKNEEIVEVKAINVPPNNGLLCVKGKFGYKFVNHPDRLTSPLIKKQGEFVKATWEEAYSLITGKAKELKSKYGGNVFGGLSSARCTNEENYLFQKLIRAVFGTNNIDHCARL